MAPADSKGSPPLLVIPAAGKSSRMGDRDKLLEDIDGVPLLRRQVLRALEAVSETVVLLGPDHAARRRVIDNLSVRIETVADADEGMGATLRHASRLPVSGQDLAILLPDVPGVTSDDILMVIGRFYDFGGGRVTRASDPQKRPGTPVIFPATLLPGLAGLTGDDGGRSLIDPDRLELVALDDDRATCDLDTPEDWALWRARNSG